MSVHTVRPLDTPREYRALDVEEVRGRAWTARRALGPSAVVLAHHYQTDEIMEFADFRGDSLELSRIAAGHDAPYIVFCGVDFMAESAAILCSPDQTVILPAGDAPCPMAGMADLGGLEFAWNRLEDIWGKGSLVPLVYQNSSAAVKAFCGRNGGAVCTSSNAQAAIRWGLSEGRRVLFAPDRYLATNSGLALGYSQDQIAIWNRSDDVLEAEDPDRVVLVAWDGYCSVHRRFQVEDVERVRRDHPGVQVVVHPECTPEVVQASDAAGSTAYIVRYVEEAEPGAVIAVGTELHLVLRLDKEHPDRTVLPLRRSGCVAMARTDIYNLCFSLEHLAVGDPVNVTTVPPNVAADARRALERMLEMR
ncbi:MAG: quinolinate synthase NadA [Anaerolineae bacterium]|nr:quinolinate synthase NadA [Anaerolineae bacterium]